MAYETLNRVRRPPDMAPPPPQHPLQQQNQLNQPQAPPANTIAKPFIQRSEPNKNIHVFINLFIYLIIKVHILRIILGQKFQFIFVFIFYI